MKYIVITICLLAASIIIPIIVILILDKVFKIKIKRRTKIISAVSSSLILISIPVLIFMFMRHSAKPELVNDYLLDSEEVKVTETSDYYFFDNQNVADKAFIFYTGAKIEEKSYVPLMRKIADKGYDAFIMKFPFVFPIFSMNKGNIILENFHYESVYFIGHSLGGTCANRCTINNKNNTSIKGMIFLASYPDRKMREDIFALSIYGSKDQVLSKKEYDNNKTNFSPNFTEYIIEGGIHSYFGCYGIVGEDNNPQITNEEQISITANYIHKYISGQI